MKILFFHLPWSRVPCVCVMMQAAHKRVAGPLMATLVTVARQSASLAFHHTTLGWR